MYGLMSAAAELFQGGAKTVSGQCFAGPSRLTHTKQYPLPVVMLKRGHRICGYSIQDSTHSSLNSARPMAHLPLPFMAKAWSSAYLYLLCLQEKISYPRESPAPCLVCPGRIHPRGRSLPSERRDPEQRFAALRWVCQAGAASCPHAQSQTCRWGHGGHPTRGAGQVAQRNPLPVLWCLCWK